MSALAYKLEGKAFHAKASFLYPALPPELKGGRVIVEVGPGRGDFLFHLAEQNPEATVIAIEIKGKRIDRLIQRIERRGLKNVSLIQDDAREALPRLFPEESIDEIHINFPDPWPKKRHEKNRALSADFLAECCRALKIGGTISIATDHQPYAKEIAANAANVKQLKSCNPEAIIAECPDAYPTLFATKWRDAGRTITYQKYRKANMLSLRGTKPLDKLGAQ